MTEDSSQQAWSWGPRYRQRLQSPEQIEEIIALLRLDAASGLLDVGCGNGVFALEAARRFPHCRVWACDPHAGGIAECAAATGDMAKRNLRAFVASAEQIPLPDRCADRVLMRNVLHHVGDVDAAFGEIERLLQPGGRIVLEGPFNPLDEATGRFLTELYRIWDSTHRRRYYRPERILGWLAAAGVATESVKSWIFPVRLRPRLVEYVRQQKTDEKLRLRRHDCDNWYIDGHMLRILGTKRPIA